MVAWRRPLFRIGSGLWLVESLSRARWRDRVHGADERRVRTAAVAVQHVDLRLRVRRSPDLMLRPRRRLDPGHDRPRDKAFRDRPDRIHRHFAAPRRSGTGRIYRRLTFGATRADRPGPGQWRETGSASRVR